MSKKGKDKVLRDLSQLNDLLENVPVDRIPSSYRQFFTREYIHRFGMSVDSDVLELLTRRAAPDEERKFADDIGANGAYGLQDASLKYGFVKNNEAYRDQNPSKIWIDLFMTWLAISVALPDPQYSTLLGDKRDGGMVGDSTAEFPNCVHLATYEAGLQDERVVALSAVTKLSRAIRQFMIDGLTDYDGDRYNQTIRFEFRGPAARIDNSTMKKLSGARREVTQDEKDETESQEWFTKRKSSDNESVLSILQVGTRLIVRVNSPRITSPNVLLRMVFSFHLLRKVAVKTP